MSSKIFKSSYMSDSSRLEIEASIASSSFHITHCTVVSEKSFMLDNTTAPALALAILEAAGHGGSSESSRLMQAFDLIELHVNEQERITAEAKEQAELEAEAFKLRRAYLEGRAGFDSWNELTDPERDHWLAVARKSREMAKESTNGR